MRFPEYEGKKKIPAGHYQFRLNKEPELIAFPYKDAKTGEEKKGHKIKLYAVGINSAGEFSVIDQIPAWDPRYADLLKALQIEHGRDIQVEGSVFEADIIHEADKTDPTKSYPRIVKIIPTSDIPQGKDVGGGDDIPF
jgi:hypothetical protein